MANGFQGCLFKLVGIGWVIRDWARDCYHDGGGFDDHIIIKVCRSQVKMYRAA